MTRKLAQRHAYNTTVAKMNNNLIVFLKDGSKHVLSFPLGHSEEEALESYRKIYSSETSEVKKYFFIENDTVSPKIYRDHYGINEKNELTMSMRSAFIEKVVTQIKAQRDHFLKSLDIPFMKALEDEDDVLKSHVIKLKGFLRDLPDKLRFNEIERDADILKYDPFGNIFEVIIVDQGEGYTSPPKVTIDSPSESRCGFQAKAVAFVKDGKVEKIEITDCGSGYDFAPNVTIEAPESGKQAKAAHAYPQNSVISQEVVISNTKNLYS